MALIITIFLMLVNISSSERANGPPAKSMTALDIWMLICMTFVAGSLLEFAILLKIRFKSKSLSKRDHTKGGADTSSVIHR